MGKDHKTILENVLSGKKVPQTPIWIMRQAGRYLPEYREIRAQAGDFLSLCYNPDYASEVTLQPIRRFDFDAAILFSDILVIPHALGQNLRFVQGEGPKLDALNDAKDLSVLKLDTINERLAPIYETVSQVRRQLPQDKTLIGFAGAPWTVACYMIEGGGSKDFLKVKNFMFSKDGAFDQLIDMLVSATSSYLIKQIEHGADIVQIFDSWAGLLDPLSYQKCVIAPTKKIVSAVKTAYPHVKIIGFSRSSGANLKDYAMQMGIDGVGLDTAIDRSWVKSHIQSTKAVQGNLDPALLRAGGENLEYHVKAIMDDFADAPFIFNCGHGIIKDTPIENVEKLVHLVRNYKG